MDNHNQCNYVNPQNVSLDWECFIISKSEMLLDVYQMNLSTLG